MIGEIESISTLTAAIASGMGVTVLPSRPPFIMQYGERLDGAHHNPIDESAIIVERISQRELVAPCTGSEGDPVVVG